MPLREIKFGNARDIVHGILDDSIGAIYRAVNPRTADEAWLNFKISVASEDDGIFDICGFIEGIVIMRDLWK